MPNRGTMAGVEDGATRQECPAYIAELHAQSCGRKFGLSMEDFAGILQEVSSWYLPGATASEAMELHCSLKVEDLVLARACANGNEHA